MKTTDSVSRLPAVPGRSPIKITRRFAVASLLVIAVAVALGTTAPAYAGQYNYPQKKQVKLHPAADSPSPNAIGMVTVYYDRYRGFLDAVTVSVSKLAPNASYFMTGAGVGVSIQTDASGNGEGWWRGYSNGYSITSYLFQVYDSSGTLVLTSSR